MTLEEIYYIGQTVAVALIFPTLVFLAIQNRQSQKQMDRANEIARAEFSGTFLSTHRELTLRMVDDVDLGRAFRRFTIENKRIEDEDTLTRLMGWFASYHTLWMDMHEASKLGLVDDLTFTTVSGNQGFHMTFPVVWKFILSITAQRELRPGEFEDAMNTLGELRETALSHKSDMVARYSAQPEKEQLVGEAAQ